MENPYVERALGGLYNQLTSNIYPFPSSRTGKPKARKTIFSNSIRYILCEEAGLEYEQLRALWLAPNCTRASVRIC